MDLVIDANIIISAIISFGGKTNELIFSDKTDLFAPEYLMEEFNKHKLEILEKSGLAEVELDLALAILYSKIKFIPFSEFKQFISKSKEVCPDADDTEYFALALKSGCPIWSNDKKLKEQKEIKIIGTTELLGLLNS